MVFVKDTLPTRQLKNNRGYIVPIANNLPHRNVKHRTKFLKEPEIPLDKLKKLQEKHREISENTAQKRLLIEHNHRMQIASELDRLRGNPGLVQGLVHQRVQKLSKAIGFDPKKHGSAYEAV
jgi:hypothetical protein